MLSDIIELPNYSFPSRRLAWTICRSRTEGAEANRDSSYVLLLASRDLELGLAVSREPILRAKAAFHLKQPLQQPNPSQTDPINRHNGIRLESSWHYVSQLERIWSARRCRTGSDLVSANSYNRYLAVAARVVRRSLKEDKRIVAERRGESDLRFAKWSVSASLESKMGCFSELLLIYDPSPTEWQDRRRQELE